MFLRFLTSLIKLILWLTFFHRQKASRGPGVKDHRVLRRFTSRTEEGAGAGKQERTGGSSKGRSWKGLVPGTRRAAGSP